MFSVFKIGLTLIEITSINVYEQWKNIVGCNDSRQQLQEKIDGCSESRRYNDLTGNISRPVLKIDGLTIVVKGGRLQ